MATPLRNVRISDALWEAAQAKAAEEGVSLSDAIRNWLEVYTGQPDPERETTDV